MGPILWAALGLVVCLPCSARAAPQAVEVEVISVRGERAYLRADGVQALRPGQVVTLRGAGGDEQRVRLEAVSSRYLSVLASEGQELALARGDRLTVLGEGRALGEGEAGPPEPAVSPGDGSGEATSAVRVGRQAPTAYSFQSGPLPERERVAFRRREPPPPPPGGDGRPDLPAGDVAAGDPEDADAGLTASGLPANEVRGRIEVGVDGVYDDAADVSRTTPYLRLHLEVRQLGGSDRARLLLHGAARHPIDGERDWTGHDEEEVIFRLTALALEVDALPEEQVDEFTDRLELSLGRIMVPGVIDAGLVDGARFGVRFGSFTPFAFVGFGASANPRREDYDSLIVGGGVRLAHAFSHSGVIRLSLAGAHERWRGEGERDFLEARADARFGRFGVRGALVVDFFSVRKDEPDTRVTTGLLSVYAQLTESIRVEAGYRERRPQDEAELIEQDLEPIQILFLQHGPRNDLWASLLLDLTPSLELRLRGEYLTGSDTREMYGAVVGVGWKPVERHRLDLDVAVRHREQGPSGALHTTDPTVVLSHTYRGDAVTSILTLAFRDTYPHQPVHDRRVGLRWALDGDLGGGFGLRGHVGLDLRRTQGPAEDRDGTTAYVGLAARYRF